MKPRPPVAQLGFDVILVILFAILAISQYQVNHDLSRFHDQAVKDRKAQSDLTIANHNLLVANHRLLVKIDRQTQRP